MPGLSYAKDVPVQLVYQGPRSPRPIASAAKIFFSGIGVNLKFKFIRKRRIPRPTSCGVGLLHQYADTLIPLAQPGAETIMLAPAGRSSYGRELLCGAAPICGSIGVATWWNGRQDAVEWLFIHELAHGLGAQHTEEPSFLSPSWSAGAWRWSARSIEQIYACKGW